MYDMFEKKELYCVYVQSSKDAWYRADEFESESKARKFMKKFSNGNYSCCIRKEQCIESFAGEFIKVPELNDIVGRDLDVS